MQARVETAIDGGTVEIVYTTDPKCVDGLTQREMLETVLGLIPALMYATTYVTVDQLTLAEAYRDFADIYDPPGPDSWKAEHYEISQPGYTYWENEH